VRRMVTIIVIFFVVGAIFSGPDVVQPFLVLPVPFDCLAQSVVEEIEGFQPNWVSIFLQLKA